MISPPISARAIPSGAPVARTPAASATPATSAAPGQGLPAVLPAVLLLRHVAAVGAVYGAYLLANGPFTDFHAAIGTLGLLILAGLLAHEVSLLLLGAAAMVGGVWALVSGSGLFAPLVAIAVGSFMLFNADLG